MQDIIQGFAHDCKTYILSKGDIYGCQIVGFKGVDKRIDVVRPPLGLIKGV